MVTLGLSFGVLYGGDSGTLGEMFTALLLLLLLLAFGSTMAGVGALDNFGGTRDIKRAMKYFAAAIGFVLVAVALAALPDGPSGILGFLMIPLLFVGPVVVLMALAGLLSAGSWASKRLSSRRGV